MPSLKQAGRADLARATRHPVKKAAGQVPPNDLLKILNERQWGALCDAWRRWSLRPGADMARVAGILREAWFHAAVERMLTEQLNRKDFDDRRDRLYQKLGELGQEILALTQNLKPLATLAALRARPFLWDGKGNVTFGEAVFTSANGQRDPSPFAAIFPESTQVIARDAETIDLGPIAEAYAALSDALKRALTQLGAPLHRRRGRQTRPWIAPAMRELRAAGLPKLAADEMLSAIGLKGPDTARQTVPLR